MGKFQDIVGSELTDKISHFYEYTFKTAQLLQIHYKDIWFPFLFLPD